MSGSEKKAKKEAQRAYHESLKKVKKTTELGRLDTSSARKLEDELGTEISLTAKNIARKADKVGKQINEVAPEYNKSAERFNKRVDDMGRQMSGESVTGYVVDKKRFTDPQNISGLASTSLLDMKDNDWEAPFSTREAAMPAAMEAKNEMVKATSGVNGIQNQNMANIANHNINQNDLIREVKLGKIGNDHHSLSATEGAYKDIEALGKNVNAAGEATGMNRFAKQYQALADKLKSVLRRDQPVVAPKTGLIGSDIITGNASPIAKETF
jgi:hypothetical protein